MTETKHSIKEKNDFLVEKLLYIQANYDLQKTIFEHCKSGKEFENVLKIAPAFMSITLANIHNVMLLELGKIYDEGRRSHGLKYLLNLCIANQHLFLKKRTARYTNVDNGEIIRVDYPMNIKGILQKNEQKYEEAVKQRSALKSLRDQVIAHSDKIIVGNLIRTYENCQLTYNCIEELIKIGFDICQDISYHIDGTKQSKHYDNVDDILQLFDFSKKEKNLN